MTFALDASGVHKRYGKRVALAEFGLQLEAGQIHGLLGPNGSGKTTGLHIITGLLAPDGGAVLIGGTPVSDKASRALFGFAPDDLPLPAALTGREYLAFHDAMRRRHDWLRAREMADIFGLTKDLDKQVGQYSHGMKRKLQVVAALCHEPQLAIFDEPFRGLDPDASAALREMLAGFAGMGGTVLIATHDMLRAERDCDEVTILSQGAIVGTGAPQNLLAEQSDCSTLEELFLRVTGLRDLTREREARIASVFSGPIG
jgi:ABC-2 type transport system ATP-binding protein